jgi:NAD(P)H-dependent FMN reductase
MPKLGVVICSTRPNRLGLPVARWFVDKAKPHGKFQVEVIDLKEIALPPLDEPNHPMKRQYEHEHTKAWSRTISSLDAFVFVTPEYNYSLPPALVNALDYLFHEWNYKAACFVSYGGVSAGTRSVQMSKQTVTALRMMAIPEGVFIPFAAKLVAGDRFDPGTTQDEAVTRMLDELLRWTTALEMLRRPA